VNTNRVSLISVNEKIDLPLLTKFEVAHRIFDRALVIKQNSFVHP
jgi:hypothetical protein